VSTTRAVTALAALIHDSQQRRATAYGVALDVDSAQMLLSPETAAELDTLRKQVADRAALLPEYEAEILARAEAATPGPWCADQWEIYQGEEYIPGVSPWLGETCDVARSERSRENAAFVAAARTDVPALLAETARLRAQVAELESALDTALAMHPKHVDSEHCQADGEPWPCATRIALESPDTEPAQHPAAPDPLAYGPTGYRCGCGKDAHSNFTPCRDDAPGGAS
jgi:hypothetical protein